MSDEKKKELEELFEEVDQKIKKGTFPDSLAMNPDVIWVYGSGDRKPKSDEETIV